MNNIVIRTATEHDYPSFHAMELRVWNKTGIETICKETFVGWCQMNNASCLVGVDQNNTVQGQVYAQVCSYNPRVRSDSQRNYQDIVGDAQDHPTQGPQGNCLYIASICAEKAGLGARLTREIFELSCMLRMQFTAGSCRLSGLAHYCKKNELPDTRETVWEYVRRHHSNHRNQLSRGERDPVLSVFLRLGMKSHDVVADFLHPLVDRESLGWACVLGREHMYVD